MALPRQARTHQVSCFECAVSVGVEAGLVAPCGRRRKPASCRPASLRLHHTLPLTGSPTAGPAGWHDSEGGSQGSAQLWDVLSALHPEVKRQATQAAIFNQTVSITTPGGWLCGWEGAGAGEWQGVVGAARQARQPSSPGPCPPWLFVGKLQQGQLLCSQARKQCTCDRRQVNGAWFPPTLLTTAHCAAAAGAAGGRQVAGAGAAQGLPSGRHVVPCFRPLLCSPQGRRQGAGAGAAARQPGPPVAAGTHHRGAQLCGGVG